MRLLLDAMGMGWAMEAVGWMMGVHVFVHVFVSMGVHVFPTFPMGVHVFSTFSLWVSTFSTFFLLYGLELVMAVPKFACGGCPEISRNLQRAGLTWSKIGPPDPSWLWGSFA